MAMTKTDYEIVADALNDVLWRPQSDPITVTRTIAALTDRFTARYGEKFRRDLFLGACLRNRDVASQDWRKR